MITPDDNFKNKARTSLESTDFNSICLGIYEYVNDKCSTMPVGDEKAFIEAMMMKCLIDYLIKGWKKGCEAANFDPRTVKAVLDSL